MKINTYGIGTGIGSGKNFFLLIDAAATAAAAAALIPLLTGNDQQILT